MHLYNKQTDPFNYFLIRLAVEYMPSGFIKAKPFRISAQSFDDRYITQQMQRGDNKMREHKSRNDSITSLASILPMQSRQNDINNISRPST